MPILCVPVNKKQVLFGRITNQAFGHSECTPASCGASAGAGGTGESGPIVFRPGSLPRG